MVLAQVLLCTVCGMCYIIILLLCEVFAGYELSDVHNNFLIYNVCPYICVSMYVLTIVDVTDDGRDDVCWLVVMMMV